MKNYRAIIKDLPFLKGKKLSIEKLKGGLTNVNFKVRVDKKIYVARFAPDNSATLGMNKKSEVYNCTIAEKLNIGPKPVGLFPEENLFLVEYISGRVSNLKRAGSKDSIRQLAALFRKLHSGPRFKDTVDLFAQTRQYFATAQKLGSWMPKNVAYLMQSIKRIEKQLKKKSWIRPAHLDLMIANVIHTKKGLKLIDWEYAGNADCRYDLAMISFKARYSKGQDELLLNNYGSKELDLRQLELMKCIVALREAGWGLVQIKLSTLKHDYKKHAADHISRFNEIARELSL